ncbi:MAG: nitrogenase component 1 [Candidatus Aquicultor sp.]
MHNALPVIHGAQGCSFLAKVLLTKHFREPISLASTKLLTEDVVMGDEETLANVVKGFADKNDPDVIAIISSGLSEVKGDDVSSVIKNKITSSRSKPAIIHIPTVDYRGGLEDGYAKAVEGLLILAGNIVFPVSEQQAKKQVNVLAGPHLTPADFTELREIIESFDLHPIFLPDLSCLDGSRQDFTALTSGGTRTSEIRAMGVSSFTLAVGASMDAPARGLRDRFRIDYQVFESISGLEDTNRFMQALSQLSGQSIPRKHERNRNILIDGMRDAHFYYGGAHFCLALEPDLTVQTARWIHEMGAEIEYAPQDLHSINDDCDLLISSSHGEDTAHRLGIPLYQLGFPVYKVLGNTTKVTIGYKGTMTLINEVGTLLAHERPRR